MKLWAAVCYVAEESCTVVFPLSSKCGAVSSRVTRALLWGKDWSVWGQSEVLANKAGILFPSGAGFVSGATEQSVFTFDLHNIALDFWLSLKLRLVLSDSDGGHGFSARICISGCSCNLKKLSSLSLASSCRPKLWFLRCFLLGFSRVPQPCGQSPD